MMSEIISATVKSTHKQNRFGSSEYSLKDRVSGFITLIRPLFFILTPVNAAAAAVLALQGYPTLVQCLAGFFAVAFASCASNVFNDFCDRDRDKCIWPDRPIPSGRIKAHQALLVTVISMVISFALTIIFFNTATFIILLLALGLSAFYSLYLRNRIGYLSLPPIVGLIYLGGWAAFSPQTLFTSIVPWYLYLIGVVWQAAHIMVYYPLHVTPANAATTEKVPPVFFFTPAPHTAVTLGSIFTGLTLIAALLLPLLAPVGIVYFILVAVAGIYALSNALRLQNNSSSREKGLKAFTSLSLFRLIISAAILLNIFISGI